MDGPMLTGSQNLKICSPLPNLHTVAGYATKYLSVSNHRLTADQILFLDLTLAAREWLATVDVKIVSPKLPDPETHGISNESGVQGRYVQHVSSKLNPIFESLGWRVRMADYEFGVNRLHDLNVQGGQRSKRQRQKGRLVPDLVIVEEPSHHIRFVVEMKTPWTFWAGCKNKESFLAARLGQLANYMDQYECEYGCLSTYYENWFVKREGDFKFLVTENIPAAHWSTSSQPSLREVYLFFAHLAIANGKYSQKPMGKKLVDGTYDEPSIPAKRRASFSSSRDAETIPETSQL